MRSCHGILFSMILFDDLSVDEDPNLFRVNDFSDPWSRSIANIPISMESSYITLPDQVKDAKSNSTTPVTSAHTQQVHRLFSNLILQQGLYDIPWAVLDTFAKVPLFAAKAAKSTQLFFCS